MSRGWGQMWLQYPTFHTKMVCFWIDSRFSQHLSPSNFSLYIWWMVGEGGDCCVGSKIVTTTCFSVTGGVKVGLALVHFSHQDWVSLDWFGQFTASQPFQCLIVSMMNGFARLRFEFNMYNSSTLLFTPKWCMFGLIQEYHSISTLPTSHYEYNEWLEMVEIAVWALKWSSQRIFQSRVGSKLAWPLSTFHTKIEWVWTDLGNSQHLNPFNVSL